MKKNLFSIAMLAAGLTAAFAFTSNKVSGTPFYPTYDSNGNIVSWTEAPLEHTCLSGSRICTAKFVNDNPQLARISEEPGVFQP